MRKMEPFPKRTIPGWNFTVETLVCGLYFYIVSVRHHPLTLKNKRL